MRPGIQFRLAAFGSTVLLAALLMGWAAHVTWQRFEDLRQELTPEQIASFQTGDHFRATLQDLNTTLDRFITTKDTNAWARFRKEFEEINNWIDHQRPNLQTAPEVAILNRIDASYDRYFEAATNLVLRLVTSGSAPLPEESLKQVEAISAQLLQLGYQLVEAHQRSLTQFLGESNRSLALFSRVIFGALVFILMLLAWLATTVYREMIMPLRTKLVESSAIIERQEKLASLGMLAAGVAHEIRNPLTAIKAWLFIQKKHLRAGTTEHADAAIIEEEINRLERIVRDVLLFARPSEPQFIVMPSEKPLQEVQALLAPTLALSNIKLEVDGGPGASIRADAQQIKQVLINLVQNSSESIGQDGVITLRTRLDSRRLGDNLRNVVVLEVADTGKGMTAEVEKRLFDPFFTTKESGTGLGLSIAARIVEKHGGVLQYQTQVNRGTVFGIVLPRVEL